MSFELENAKAAFQRALDIILRSACWWFAVNYLYETVVFSNLPQDHIEQVKLGT